MTLKTPLFEVALTWQKAGRAYAEMMIDANTVIRERMTQMAFGMMKPEEAALMVMEKPSAFAKSIAMASQAHADQQGHAAITLAAIEPLTAKTSANAKRLTQD
ncbi:MAG: hypothetical protein ACPGNV_13290 [Mangrovicoccus sp.]